MRRCAHASHRIRFHTSARTDFQGKVENGRRPGERTCIELLHRSLHHILKAPVTIPAAFGQADELPHRLHGGVARIDRSIPGGGDHPPRQALAQPAEDLVRSRLDPQSAQVFLEPLEFPAVAHVGDGVGDQVRDGVFLLLLGGRTGGCGVTDGLRQPFFEQAYAPEACVRPFRRLSHA